MRSNIWMLDAGKRKYGGDPMGLADIMLKFAALQEHIVDPWKECAARELGFSSFEESLRPLVEEMESVLADVAAAGETEGR